MLTKIIDQITDRVLDRLVPILEKKLDELKTEALARLTEELPKLAATIAESAVTTVFDHTQIDESVDKVTGVFADLLGRFKLP